MLALLILTAAGFAGYVTLLPVAPLWAIHGGADEAGSGLVNGMLLLTTILTQPFVPWLLHRTGAAWVSAVGLILLGAPSLLHLFSDRLDWILLLSTVRGLGFGLLTVTTSTALAHLVPSRYHGAAIGAYGASIGAPQIVLLPLGPWLGDSVGYWIVFVLGSVSVLGVPAAPRLARALREQEVELRLHGDESGLGISETVARPSPTTALPRKKLAFRLARPTLILIGVTLAGGAVITFAPQMSSSSLVASSGLVLLTLTAAISRWRIGALADQYGIIRLLWPLVLLTVIGLVLTTLAVHNPNDTRIPLFLGGMALVGIAFGGLQSLTMLLALAVTRPHEYGVASAVWNVGFDTGMGLGSVLLGTIAAGFSFSFALMVTGAISLVTMPFAIPHRQSTALE